MERLYIWVIEEMRTEKFVQRIGEIALSANKSFSRRKDLEDGRVYRTEGEKGDLEKIREQIVKEFPGKSIYDLPCFCMIMS